MSRKDYKALAEAISEIADEAARRTATQAIGRVCSRDNGRFDWGRWERACNAGHEKPVEPDWQLAK